MVDYRLSGTPGSSSFVHLVHPRPVSWVSLISITAKDLSVPLVSYTEWLDRLEKSGRNQNDNADNSVETLRKIPALRLLPFYRAIAGNLEKNGTAFGLPPVSCDEAVRLSKTMSNGVLPLGENDVKSWLKFWRDVGYINLK